MDLSKMKTLGVVLFLAIMVRMSLLVCFYNAPLNIVDEQHYNTLAVNLLDHGVYSLGKKPSAKRPPLYPFSLALAFKTMNRIDHNAIRVIQVLISLVTGFFLFRLFENVFDPKIARLGLILFLFYPSLIFFNYLILTETIFIFILTTFFYSTSKFLAKGKLSLAMLSGLLLGVSSLTRSITYPMALPLAGLLCLLLVKQFKLKAVYTALLFLLAFGATLSPWTIRNARVFHSFVPVGTMGGLNLYMGNYEHTPLHRAWAAVDITDENAWYKGHEKKLSGMNEAEKQQWAIQKAKAYITSHLGQSILRSVIKTANFWGIERTIIAGMEMDYFGFFSGKWYRYIAYLMILLAYAGVVLAGSTGFFMKLAIVPSRFDIIFGFMLVSFTGLHAIVFGHSRYHLPLIPFLCGYAGWLIIHFDRLKQTHSRLLFGIGGGVLCFFCCIWGYEVLVGSFDKISKVMGL